MPARSKVQALPEATRLELNRRLIEGGFGGYTALADWLESQGFEIGRSSVHRHGAQLERRIERTRIATEGAKSFVEAVGDDQGALAEASLGLIQERMWELLVATEEGDLKALAGAARALADTARASVTVRQDRRKALREAATAAGRAARRAGVSEDTERLIREAVQGTGA